MKKILYNEAKSFHKEKKMFKFFMKLKQKLELELKNYLLPWLKKSTTSKEMMVDKLNKNTKAYLNLCLNKYEIIMIENEAYI